MVPSFLVGGQKAEVPTGYGFVNSAGTGSLLADANGWTFTGLITGVDIDITGSLDLAITATATDQLLNADLSMNSATGIGVGVDATAIQATTARTANYMAAFRGATTSLAGDLNSVKYYDYLAGTPTDGGGAVVHVAYGALTGHDVLIDCSDAATGQNVISIPDNLAIALTVKEATNTYLTFITTNLAEAVQVGKRLSIAAPMSSPVTGVQSIADNGTIALPTTGTNALVATSSAANKTGVILTAGIADGQVITLINNSANSLTFAAAGTSNVADGTSAHLAALTAMRLTWDSTSSRWYRG